MGTKIQWADETWNPVVGCRPVSEGCRNCYAVPMANRLVSMGQEKYEGLVFGNKFNGSVTFSNKELDKPLRWKKPRNIFVCSMSDLFYRPGQHTHDIIEVMKKANWHKFKVLTKRANRLEQWLTDAPDHIQIGVTIENQAAMHCRLEQLQALGIDHDTFISCEPLIGPVKFSSLSYIDQVIVGCESGPNARETDIEWVRSIREQCLDNGVKFFLKQMRINGKLVKMPELDGKVWDEQI